MSSKRTSHFKTFAAYKRGTRELNRSLEKKSNILNNPISIPPITRKGFMAPLDSHQIKREEDHAQKSRRSSVSTDEEEDGDDFRSDTKPEDTLTMPKKKTASSSSNPLITPSKRGASSTSSMKIEAIFDSATPSETFLTNSNNAKKDPNPFSSKRQGETLRVPAKKKSKIDEELKRMQGSLKESKRADERELHESQRKCDFCGEQLYPITESIREALEELEKKNAVYTKRQNQRYKDMYAASSFSTPTGYVISRPIPNDEKDEFCRLHRIQLVTIPEGIRNGYPRKIDFDKIEKRIDSFRSELEDVICGVINSEYKNLAENAYKEQGQAKARSVMSVLNRFTATLPGYYGPKGAAVILKVLTKLYIDTGYLHKHLVSSQLPLEFLQQVLVPEVGFRLIRRDLMEKRKGAPIPRLTEKAKTIMKDSAAYGNAMFPVEDAEIDDDRAAKITYIHDDDDKDGNNQDDDDDQVEMNEVYTIDSD
ncbi:hypothetical protein PS15m_004905 [Mucor circinelloides]